MLEGCLSLAEERLDDARSQLSTLQQRASGDTRLEQYQRQLAEAYMEQGREALQQGDLDRAAQALGQARSLMPQAPALSHDLNQAIDSARAARLAAAEQQARDAAAKGCDVFLMWPDREEVVKEIIADMAQRAAGKVDMLGFITWSSLFAVPPLAGLALWFEGWPAIETARDEQCLACHREVLEDKVRETSPAGIKAGAGNSFVFSSSKEKTLVF